MSVVVTGLRYVGVSSHVIYCNSGEEYHSDRDVRHYMGGHIITWAEEHHSLYDYTRVFVILGRVVQSWVSAKYEFVFESLKSISVLILFVYKTMIGSSKISRENYPRKCF